MRHPGDLIISWQHRGEIARRLAECGAAWAALGTSGPPGRQRLLVSDLCDPANLSTPPDRPVDAGAGLLQVIPADRAPGALDLLAEIGRIRADAVRAVLLAGETPRGWYAGPGWREPRMLNRIWAVGARPDAGAPLIERWPAAPDPPLADRLQRQIAVLGTTGQRRLADLSAAVVGCGGNGGPVAQLLALAGVGRITLIDDDRIEQSNRNRLIAATDADVIRGTSKVVALRRHLARLAPEVHVAALARPIDDPHSIAHVRTADIVIGCTDNEGSRLLLNRLAVQDLLPYVDCGAGFVAGGGELLAGGQVRTVLPGGPCLECYDGINRRLAADDLATPRERKRQSAHGYGLGRAGAAPALAALNAAIAAETAATVIAIATGLRPVTPYVIYDFWKGSAQPLDGVRRRPECLACSRGQHYGRGDQLDLPARGDEDVVELPDVPR